MHYPRLKPEKQITKTQDVFLGLNHNLRLREGELYDMENLTSELYPVLSPRAPRGVLQEGGGFQGITSRDGLVYIRRNQVFMNGKALEVRLRDLPETQTRQLVNMGAWVLIFPDKVYVSTADPGDFGSMEASVTTAAPLTLVQCTLDGEPIRPTAVGPEPPEAPGDRSYWVDTGENRLKQFSAAMEVWVVVETPLVKLTCPGVGRPFSLYDGVEISGLPADPIQALNGPAVLYGRGEDYLIWPGILEQPLTLETPVTVSRTLPDMDFVVESGNRLWGCRYGPDRDGKVVNALYSCRLGDFKNWSCYLGLSTDSYQVSLGSDGPFTGAAVQGGQPVFFKEACLHRVYGQMPSNFQVRTTACRGVDQGCGNSLALVGDTLFYKSREGICTYDGSLPGLISQALGKENWGRAVGGSLGSKYYVSLEKKPGDWTLMVFDTDRGLWHREDSLQARMFCPCGGDLICMDGKGRLLSMRGLSGKPEDRVSWMAETGIIGVSLPGSRYLRKLQLRLLLDPGSRISVSVQYDSGGIWESLGTVETMLLKSFTFPVLPRRCDHLRLRLQGQGGAKLFALTRVMSPGGEA